jgi:hypothetical protein
MVHQYKNMHIEWYRLLFSSVISHHFEDLYVDAPEEEHEQLQIGKVHQIRTSIPKQIHLQSWQEIPHQSPHLIAWPKVWLKKYRAIHGAGTTPGAGESGNTTW